jgi:hypothetical protein
VTNPSAISRIEQTTGTKSVSQARRLELVIDVEIIGNSPKGWRVIAYRVEPL